MAELNGFKIEIYNQYNFPENVKTYTCPLCSELRKKKTDKCLKLFWDTGLAQCFHCGEMLQLHTYKKKEIETVYEVPKWNNNTNLSDKTVKWFEGRKISQNTLKIMKITEGLEWMPQFKKEVLSIHFNYFQDNDLVNVKYRGPQKSFKMYSGAKKIFYNLDNIRTTKECIIVEGEIDCLTFVEAGIYNVVSIPNGATTGNVNLDYLDNSYEYFKNKDKIFLSLDNDEPGKNVQKELIRRFGAGKCYLIDLEDCKDANDFVLKYGKERLRQSFENSSPVPIENVTSYDNYENQLYDYYANGDKRGYTIGLESFDDKFSTYLQQFIVITGEPRSGKSDFVDQMALGYSLKNDWIGAFCSVENDPKYIHVDKLIRKLVGFRPSNPDLLKTDRWINAKNWMNKHIKFIEFKDGYDLKKVLIKAKEMVLRFGIKYLVLDPYNKIRLKESLNKGINEYTNDYLFELDTFARENDILILIVAHPVKRMRVNGKRPEIDFYDIKGGGEWFDMSPHGLMVHRDFDREIVKVKVLKVKFQNLGENEAEMYYKWNPVNGRYTPIVNDVDAMTSIFNYDFNYDSWLDKSIDENQTTINYDIEPNENPFELNDEIPF